MSPNLIEVYGLDTIGGSKGGKGGGSSGGKGKSENTQYSATVAFGVCQGPVTYINGVWVSAGVELFDDGPGLNFYAGNDGQAPDPVFETTDPNSPVLGYSGTCYVTGTPLQLGSAPALPNYSFEVQGIGYDASDPFFPQDTDPAIIVTDFLTNPRYGAGFPAANIGDLSVYSIYCHAAGLLLSPLIDEQENAGYYLDEIATITNSAIVWSGTQLKIVPYGDVYLNVTGYAFPPNLVPVYSLTDDDFLPAEGSGGDARGSGAAGSDDPVVITRINPADATNWLSIEFADRGNYYDYAVMAAFDQSAIDQFGLRIEPSIEAHGVCTQGVASTSAQLMLQRRQYVRNTVKFQLGWQYCLLEPMDIVLLTDSVLGLAAAAWRVTSVEENDNGDLTIAAEEIPSLTP